MSRKTRIAWWGIGHIASAIFAASAGILSLYSELNWLSFSTAIVADLYLILLLIEVAMRRKSAEIQRWLIDVPLTITSLFVVALLSVAIVTSFARMYLASGGVIDSNISERRLLDDNWDAIYFSAVTFATLGFGDFVPVTRGARMLVVWQLATTILFLLGILPLLVSRLADFDLRNQPPG